MSDYLYQSCFCEENIWHLCRHSDFCNKNTLVLYISNPYNSCAFWKQKPAKSSHLPVLWDYHVILLVKDVKWQVYDLDSKLPLGVDATDYLKLTFNDGEPVLPEFEARFKVLNGREYADKFQSDRSHMIGREGQWLQPPPPWPQILSEAENKWPLKQLLDTTTADWQSYKDILKMLASD